VDLPHRIVDLECGKQVGVICAVSGGEHHSLVMSLSGNVYSFGRGDAGELGWKEADDAKGRVNSGYFAWKPQRVGSNLKNYAIKQINCGSHHNIAVAIGGENVFAWYVGGWFGWFFVLFVWWWSFVCLFVWWLFSFVDDLCIDTRVCSWLVLLLCRGYGDNAALGTGKEQDEIYPTRCEIGQLKSKGRKVLQVQAGSQHSLILASRGKNDRKATED